MDRRKSIKALVIGTLSGTAVLDACTDKQEEKNEHAHEHPGGGGGESKLDAYDEAIAKKVFFTDHEMKTITVLGNIIIPKDDVSGSAEDAKVPEFIHFMANDQPRLQTPLRGGIRWIDLYCMKKYNNAFVDCNNSQQIELVEELAWPEKAKPEFAPGVAFFTQMRNLVATGFWSSKMGVEDIGYKGNVPNQWNGAPKAALDKLGVAYDEKMLKECLSFPA